MARKDSLIAGALLVAGGIAMAVSASGFPSIPVMPYGAGFFPTIVAVGLIVSGLGVLAESRGETGGSDAAGAPLEWDVLLRMGALVAIIAAFALGLSPLGFHVAGFLALAAAIALFGGGLWTVLILSPVAIILLHLLFYNLLRVPLPWGLLTPIAW